jgi:hypothetical protein
MASFDVSRQADRGMRNKQRNAVNAQPTSWAKISKEIRSHCLRIEAPPSVEPSHCVLLIRFANDKSRPIAGNGEFNLECGSAVSNDDRHVAIAHRK